MPIPLAIVEDDPSTGAILERLINGSPDFACVARCTSGEAAVARLPAVRPQVVLMDINLPGMNGTECVRRLKAVLPATQFLMLTVHQDADHIFAALSAGAVGYLLKRTTHDELLAALREIQTGGSPMTSDIARKVVQSFQRPSGPPADASLSARESEVLTMLAEGYLYKEIADALAISQPTVNTYVRRIYEKLHVRSRTEALWSR